MGGRIGRTDAITARNRCLEAMLGADDETRLALWRAALRYNERVKVERDTRLEISASRSHAYRVGVPVSRREGV